MQANIKINTVLCAMGYEFILVFLVPCFLIMNVLSCMCSSKECLLKVLPKNAISDVLLIR